MVRGHWISFTFRIFSITVGLPTGSDSAATLLAASPYCLAFAIECWLGSFDLVEISSVRVYRRMRRAYPNA